MTPCPFPHSQASGEIRAFPPEITASSLPRGTHPCPGEGRRQDEVHPSPLGTVLARSPGIRRCGDAAPSPVLELPV